MPQAQCGNPGDNRRKGPWERSFWSWVDMRGEEGVFSWCLQECVGVISRASVCLFIHLVFDLLLRDAAVSVEGSGPNVRVELTNSYWGPVFLHSCLEYAFSHLSSFIHPMFLPYRTLSWSLFDPQNSSCFPCSVLALTILLSSHLEWLVPQLHSHWMVCNHHNVKLSFTFPFHIIHSIHRMNPWINRFINAV